MTFTPTYYSRALPLPIRPKNLSLNSLRQFVRKSDRSPRVWKGAKRSVRSGFMTTIAEEDETDWRTPDILDDVTGVRDVDAAHMVKGSSNRTDSSGDQKEAVAGNESTASSLSFTYEENVVSSKTIGATRETKKKRKSFWSRFACFRLQVADLSDL